MGKRRILFLKAVAYSDLNPMIQSYLDRYRNENTELEVRSLKTGPKHLEYQYYQAIAGDGILKEVKRAEKDGFDAVIISCFDDPFLYPSREISQKIVVTAPGEASMHLAAVLGNQFSVIVGRDKWIPQMKENVHRYGLESKLASFRSLGMGVLDFHENEEETVRRMKREIRSAIETDRAEVIILGCSMQFGFYEELQKEFQVPVIDSMVASLKHTEYLLEVQERTGWRFSRQGLYERPPEEEMEEWGIN
ncbi:aspartate/glutamate racemase family protein [Dorea sp. D27]|uniref:aspartate/glutamate racemase family protein n=1 Tax=Dorea sp. D27 TaxID=658665 RepID=UPI00067322B2|nr:aspartate/glutamate racemase family protein [Dorea sp. D27]KMZ54125.1 hydantoin racemase [Dorea sp. D27]